jgi:predicted AAA+ superfamily ATPase
LQHVEDSNKHIIEEIVHQVAHLPELYEDAKSQKYKIEIFWSTCSCLESHKTFRKQLKSFLLWHAFYSVEKFVAL